MMSYLYHDIIGRLLEGGCLPARFNFEIQRPQLLQASTDRKERKKMFRNQRHFAPHPNQGFYHPHGNAHFGGNQLFQLNHPYPAPGMVQQAYTPNWVPQNYCVPPNHPNHQAYAPQRNPNWGYQNWNAPPPPPHHGNFNQGLQNDHVPVNHATGGNPSYPTGPAPDRSLDQRHSNHPVPPEPACPPPEIKTEDPPAPALDTKQDLEQKDYSKLFNPEALPFFPRAAAFRETAEQFTPVESTNHQSANESPQLAVQDANPANVSASEDMSSSNNENDMKEKVADLKEQLMHKDVHLSELKEKRQMDKKDRQFEEQELDAKRKTLDAELEFGMSCGQEVTVLTDKLEKLNQAAEERKTEAHKLALQKLEMLKKELQEKTRYNLELTQRLKMEEEAEKDIQQEIPLVSEPEVMKDQVEADEMAEPQDLNVKPQNDPSEAEVISKQTEPEETDSIIVSQPENEEQVETEETDSIMIMTKDLEISKEPSKTEVDPPSDPESGHQDSEEPDALLPEQTKPKKLSLWKRFKNFFTKRHRQKNKQKPKI
ncbi:protein split ends [Oryzias melastigma]|uniref:protein split ends n=1 Tax=Oryzias melastigma TaxID=30732 RepID=UPI000CF7E52E|nr:protein split ends [Oryzias melastigma]